MRGVWILSGLAVVISIVALVVSAIALLSPDTDDSEPKFEADSFHLADRGEFTVDMVVKALELYANEGREETIRYYNTPESTDGQWYVFIADESDKLIAHPNPDLLGVDLKGDVFVGADGYRYGELISEATVGGNWVDYLYENPATGNQEYKHSWVIKRDGLIFGSGWYQVLPKFE